MKILITYKSKTDFTKRYAEMIANEVNCDILPFLEVTNGTMSSYDTIVFGGGLYAGGVNGLKKANDMFHKSSAKQLIVFATGGTPNEGSDKEIAEVWARNLSPEELDTVPHFYMQAGLCYEKMSFPNRLMMKMFASMLGKKADKTDYEKGFAEAIKSSYDIFDKKYAEPLIQHLKGL